MNQQHTVAQEIVRSNYARQGPGNGAIPDEAPPLLTRPERKIAILGTTPSRMQGPIAEDSGWEIWTIGPGGKDAHRWDRLYEMHRTHPDDFKEYLDSLKAVEAPRRVYTLFPLEGAKSNFVINPEPLFKKYGRMWFSSSISYALCMAIEEGCTDLGCWGIDLESGEEYISQFQGCKFFLTLARLAGINVHLPDSSGLLRDPTPYPDRYETLFALMTEKKKKWLEQMIGQLEPQFESLKAEVHRQEGRLVTMKGLGADAKEIQEAERILGENNIHLGQQAAQVSQLKGELSSTEFWRRMFVYNISDPQDGRHGGA